MPSHAPVPSPPHAPSRRSPSPAGLARRVAASGALPLLVVAALVLVALALVGVSRWLGGSPDRPAGPPVDASAPYRDASRSVEARVADLLPRMTLEEKVGQMAQIERAVAVAAPEDLASYGIGSVLSGGGSAPEPNTVAGWADMYDGLQRAVLRSRLVIPLIYGVDAVHGHNTVRDATIFPHHIGLGATRDPELVRRIGEATAEEMALTGVDWTFGPCLCTSRNVRWGRTYECFGETPGIVAPMASEITGLQGERLGATRTSVLATAKHYLGDGGTTGGRDQGDTEVSDAELRAVHLPAYREAVERGVGSVMVSFSSVNGTRMHAHKKLITEVLKGELGFEGFVVSDFAGVDQLDGAESFTARELATAVNAGIDMVMIPEDYRRFVEYLVDEVRAGRVPQARIDDAVRRILTKKFELGLFERPFTDRSLPNTLGGREHRALAREAVRRSLVLLRNEGGVLPLDRRSKIFVAGRNADDIGNSSGGWTMTWQGSGGEITSGTTVLEGIREVAGPGARVTFDRDGRGIDDSYDVAVAVVGETPYAEYEGDRPEGLGLDREDLAVIGRLRAAGVPVVVVLVSGRPLDVAPHLSDWAGLVAAWLPGTEGAGVADVLFGDVAPTGRLPVTWMRRASQEPVNAGDGRKGLFPLGYGLTYRGR